MAVGAFVGVAIWAYAIAPVEPEASLRGGVATTTTGGTTGSSPGYIVTLTKDSGECKSTGPLGSGYSRFYADGDEALNTNTHTVYIKSGGLDGGNPAPPETWGEADCDEYGSKFEATFTWQAGTNDISPPDVLIIKEEVSLFAVGDEPYVDCVMPAAYSPASTVVGCAGVRYTVVQNPGDTPDPVTLAPVAYGEVVQFSESGEIVAEAEMTYQVTCYTARIELTGVVDPETDKSLVIGQKLTAMLKYDGSTPSSQTTNYTWTIDAGLLPFKSYDPYKTSDQKEDYSPPNADTTSFYVAKPKVNALVKCTVVTTNPNLSLFVEEEVTSTQPTKSLADETMGTFLTIKWVQYGNPPQLVPQTTSTDPTEMKLLKPGKPGGYTILGRLIDPGAPYTSDPAPSGLWNYTQLVTPDVWIEDNQGPIYGPMNNLKGLDGSFPYPKGRDAQGNLIPGDFHSAAPSADPFLFVDSPAVGPLDLTGVFKGHYYAPFELYLMYKPPGDSAWTPRVKITWIANGECEKVNGVWSVTTNSSAPGSVADWYEHPEWERVHT